MVSLPLQQTSSHGSLRIPKSSKSGESPNAKALFKLLLCCISFCLIGRSKSHDQVQSHVAMANRGQEYHSNNLPYQVTIPLALAHSFDLCYQTTDVA